jgi:SAM-dependent methyltransferase
MSVARRIVRRLRRRSATPVRHDVPDRNAFVGLIGTSQRVLEIGPFAHPMVRGDNVDHLDVLPTEGLRQRAISLGMDPGGVPDIRWVSSGGDLDCVTERYDSVVSSHAIEHQPDLIRHLQQVEALLRPGGTYYLLVPDHRYCFDHFLVPSTTAEVIGAHVERRRVHTAASVIEHRALTTHNDPVRHWAGDHGDPLERRTERIASALQEIQDAAGGYIDVHAWYFTPPSFRRVIDDLRESGFVGFSVQRMFPTRPNANEFWCILTIA